VVFATKHVAVPFSLDSVLVQYHFHATVFNLLFFALFNHLLLAQFLALGRYLSSQVSIRGLIYSVLLWLSSRSLVFATEPLAVPFCLVLHLFSVISFIGSCLFRFWG